MPMIPGDAIVPGLAEASGPDLSDLARTGRYCYLDPKDHYA
ncbi:hypothetical protein [Pedobacter yulinensis]|nr:hypothetical protein [Pedobacter yulinensis]